MSHLASSMQGPHPPSSSSTRIIAAPLCRTASLSSTLSSLAAVGSGGGGAHSSPPLAPRQLGAGSRSSATTLEEERRIFYVALTRAKKQLVITYPLQDGRFGELEPSQFLDAIPVSRRHVWLKLGEKATPVLVSTNQEVSDPASGAQLQLVRAHL